ncbi:MAG: uroporphyrinogen decarboxylase family protein [Candidatus Zixiibacteriota bacterium]
MIEHLNHTERLQALIDGVKPDRPPVALWRHFYRDEDDLDRFVEAMVTWQKRFDWDLLKINPRASYHYEPWGVIMRPSPDELTKPERVGFPISNPEDWAKVAPVSVKHPMFDFQLRAIARIRRALPPPFRIVMTVFNPISIAGDMVPTDAVLQEHLRTVPDAVEWALTAIATTFADLVVEMRNAGADGVFFATTQWASAERLTVDELRRFALPYDRLVWDAAGGDAFNVLHVCDTKIHLAEYREFPAALVNWDATDPDNPSLCDGHAALGRPVMGGVPYMSELVNDTPDILEQKILRLISENGDIPFAVGPGCAIPVTAPDENVAAIRRAVNAVGR